MKREEWQQRKIKAIKASTIKGLEPEIQTLIAKNKTALQHAENMAQEQIQRQRNELTSQHQAQMQALRWRRVGVPDAMTSQTL